MPSGQTLCLCLVVRDRAPLLRACLDSVRPLIDSWVVVDAGSTDGSQDVVRRALAGLPGALHERPGETFARARAEALDLARRHGTYCLLIEAEERLDVPSGTRPPVLAADSYTLDVACGDTVSRRPRILRTALPWRYDGVIPETLACATADTAGHLPGPILRRPCAGRRDSEAGRLAIAAVEAALAAAPTPRLAAHYTFHLALLHRDRRETDAAIARFLERADQGFSPDEVYVALLEAGRLMQRAGRPLAAVLAPLDRAMALIPTRAEAPHAASGACRMHADHARATRYAVLAAGMPRPEHGLFLEPWIYAYGALDEVAVNAYWAGDDRTSLEATLRALASGAVPEDQRARFLANTRFPLDRLAGGVAQCTRQCAKE
ncbi:glycosyl transferase [Methylobacterium aquaticum]|nr:glycosyl transferase [Methylobacterium aquaticum]